jgi:hypothetical protein
MPAAEPWFSTDGPRVFAPRAVIVGSRGVSAHAVGLPLYK